MQWWFTLIAKQRVHCAVIIQWLLASRSPFLHGLLNAMLELISEHGGTPTSSQKKDDTTNSSIQAFCQMHLICIPVKQKKNSSCPSQLIA
jgi:hypothetical protein